MSDTFDVETGRVSQGSARAEPFGPGDIGNRRHPTLVRRLYAPPREARSVFWALNPKPHARSDGMRRGFPCTVPQTNPHSDTLERAQVIAQVRVPIFSSFTISQTPRQHSYNRTGPWLPVPVASTYLSPKPSPVLSQCVVHVLPSVRAASSSGGGGS